MMMMITTKIIGLDENNENTDDHRVIKRRGEASLGQMYTTDLSIRLINRVVVCIHHDMLTYQTLYTCI